MCSFRSMLIHIEISPKQWEPLLETPSSTFNANDTFARRFSKAPVVYAPTIEEKDAPLVVLRPNGAMLKPWEVDRLPRDSRGLLMPVSPVQEVERDGSNGSAGVGLQVFGREPRVPETVPSKSDSASARPPPSSSSNKNLLLPKRGKVPTGIWDPCHPLMRPPTALRPLRPRPSLNGRARDPQPTLRQLVPIPSSPSVLGSPAPFTNLIDLATASPLDRLTAADSSPSVPTFGRPARESFSGTPCEMNIASYYFSGSSEIEMPRRYPIDSMISVYSTPNSPRGQTDYGSSLSRQPSVVSTSESNHLTRQSSSVSSSSLSTLRVPLHPIGFVPSPSTLTPENEADQMTHGSTPTRRANLFDAVRARTHEPKEGVVEVESVVDPWGVVVPPPPKVGNTRPLAYDLPLTRAGMI